MTASPEHSQAFELGNFRGEGYSKGRNTAWQIGWLMCQSSIFRRWWLPARLRTSLLRLFGAEVGANVLIRHDVTIHWPWKLTVGDNSWIGVGTWILNLEPVTIGANTCVSQGVMLCTGSHDRHSPTFEFDNGPINIGDSVWVATRATVLRGVTIGSGSTIGACALVTRNVEPGSLVVSPSSTVR